MSAGAALQDAAITALSGIQALNGAYPGRPIQAALPYATAEIGGEADWGHKSGAGREVRLLVTIEDAAERPNRVQELAAAAEAALTGVPAELGAWRLVSLRFMRARLVQGKGGWAAALDYRARLLEA